MSRLTQWVSGSVKSAFGYDAVKDKDHLPQIAARLQSEDDELKPREREKLLTIARDNSRNFTLAGSMVRQYLAFTSDFSFRCVTRGPDGKLHRELNRVYESFIDYVSEPARFDVAGRHSRRRALRLSAARVIIDGDIGWMKLRDGRCQLIEGDRIADPKTAEQVRAKDLSQWKKGLKLDDAGKTLAYAINRRNGTKLEFERDVAASRMFFLAHYDSRPDQVRGVSRMAAALDQLRSCYAGIDAHLAKSQLAAQMGVAVHKQSLDYLDSEAVSPEERAAIVKGYQKAYQVKKGQINTWLLGSNDKISEFASRTPPQEWQEFMRMTILIAMQALDMPLQLLDASRTNYSGIQAALSLFMNATRDTRRDNKALLNNWTRWRLGLGIINGEVPPPEDFGVRFEDIRWDYTNSTIPFLDKGRMVAADIASVQAGFESPGQIIEQRGLGRFEDVIDRIADEQAYMKEKGVVLAGPQVVLDLSANLPEREDKDDAED